MPRSRAVTPRESIETRTPVQIVRDAADAMFRAALECCHQHDRVARISAKSAVEEELQAAQESCRQCTDALRTLSVAYEDAAAAIKPTGSDEDWWHRANALWLASREYLRRNGACEESSKELKAHGPDRLDALHMEYEFEASSLLALRHAADAYQENRPTAA